MSEYGFTKKDWVLFREKIADWQEAYMDKLNKEYIELLNGEGTPSEKFWTLEERIRNDKKDQRFSGHSIVCNECRKEISVVPM